MPRRNNKAGQPNRAAQKNRHASRVVTREWFRVEQEDEEEPAEVKRA